MSQNSQLVGKVLWFNNFKGYGFIEDDDGKRYLAHYSSVESKDKRKTLDAGTRVRFSISSDLQKPLALNINGVAESIEVIQ